MSDRKLQEESAGRLSGLLSERRRSTVADVMAAHGAPLAALGMASPLMHPDVSRGTIMRGLETRTDQLIEARFQPAALEAIVRLTGRPPFIIRDSQVVIQPELLADLPADTALRIRAVEPVVGSVGRVEFVNHPSSTWGGTGWVIDGQGNDRTRLVITNRHVASMVARRTQDGKGIFLRSAFNGMRMGCRIDFNEEVDAQASESREVPVADIVYLADDLAADAALLRVRVADGAPNPPDALLLAEKEAEQQELVALIGYPAYDTRNDVTAMEKYFQGLYDVKRFSPGRILQAAKDGVISYDCTSLGGNSGSPLISLESRKVVGLHFAGTYGVGNSAVSVRTLQALRQGAASLSIPVMLAKEAAEAAPADGLHPAEALQGRDGFDTAFLGKAALTTPWPTLPAELASGLAKPSDAVPGRPHEVRYTHFGVLFSGTHRLPLVSAVNIDGGHTVRIKREADQWWRDGRIDPALQHGSEAYVDAAIDRGHMVRREDPNWGGVAQQANDDTFHLINCAPQHVRMNRGKALWQGLENYVLDSARTHGLRANVFTGPVIGEEDPEIEGGLRVPMEFWKVVVMRAKSGRKLHATAYLLSQGQMIRKLMEDRAQPEAREGFTFGPYRTFQIAIADLEAATGYDFGTLRDADPLARTKAGQEALAHRTPAYVVVDRPTDIVT